MTYNRHSSADDCIAIVSGELRGVVVPLENDETRIGYGHDCDIILSGEEVIHSEATIKRHDDRYSIGAEVGRVRVGARYLKPGKSCVVTSKTPISIGSIDLMIGRSRVSAEHAFLAYHRRSTGRAWAATLGVSVIAIAGVAISGALGVSIASHGVLPDVKSIVGTPSDDTSRVAASALRAKFDEVGLDLLSAVPDEGNRVVTVRGKLRESDRVSWSAARTWFDAQFGDRVLLDPRLSDVADRVTLPFAVEAVWMGAKPRLTLHDGTQKQPGDILPGGWRLDGISVDRVEISKDGETLVVPL